MRFASCVLALLVAAFAEPAQAGWVFGQSRIFGAYASLATPSGDAVFLVCDQSALRLGFRFARLSDRDLRRRGLAAPDLGRLRFIVETERGYRIERTAERHQPRRQREPAWFGAEGLTGNDAAALGVASHAVLAVELRYRPFFHAPQQVVAMGDVGAALRRVAGRRCTIPEPDPPPEERTARVTSRR